MRRILFAATLSALALVHSTLATAQVAATDSTGRGGRRQQFLVPGRSMVTSKLGIVASSSPMAASSGVQILERGGNAIDAAIAADATIGLTEPMSFSVGGDLFAIVYIAAENKLYGLNSSGWAATGMTPAFLASKNVTRLTGVWSVTVPGAVAGWQALRDKFGKLPLSTSLAPAIYYAENGFPVTQIVSGEWGNNFNENAAEIFAPTGRAPREGDVFKNPFLATTYKRIAAQGRDGFYKGPTAQAIVDVLKGLGGTMTMADLADFQPEWQDPISTTYRGWTVYEMPPQGQGIGALMMLNLMEQFPIASWGYKTTKVMHTMIEAKKLAYADIIKYVGDPKFSTIPVAQMLSKTRAAERAKLINPTKANCNVDAGKLDGVTNSEGNDTIYLTVIDKDGNIVSLISSVYSGWGSRIAPKQQGFVLHNRGGLFTLAPNQVNTIAPHKRPLHTIIPAFMEKDGTRIGFGIMGGWNQSQAHAQFVSNIADYGMNIQEALEAGRFTMGQFEGCVIDIEPLIADSVRTALTAMGHQLNVARPRSGTFGWGQAVMSNPAGVHFGASEPRHDGEAIPEGAPVFGPPGRVGGVGRASGAGGAGTAAQRQGRGAQVP
jgi:gamma-glutamyltranspeptidase/glutathione hydrolase